MDLGSPMGVCSVLDKTSWMLHCPRVVKEVHRKGYICEVLVRQINRTSHWNGYESQGRLNC